MKRFALTVFTALLLFQSTSAQDMGTQSPMEASPLPQITGTRIEKMTGLFSATFQATAAGDVFRIFALQTGLQFMVSPRISGTITANFKDVPIKDAFFAVLTANQLYYLEQGMVIKILTSAEYRAELQRGYLETKIFDASLIDIKNLGQVITPLLTPGIGRFTIDQQSAKIIVSDISDNLDKIEMFFKELSALPRQVEIEIKIVQVGLEDGNEMGVNWQAIATNNSLFDIKFNSITSNGLASGGLAAGANFTIDTVNVNAMLGFLASKYKTKVISQPKVLAVNRGEATIHIGYRVPYIKSIVQNTTTTGGTTSQVEFIDVGVKLVVTPVINEKGDVRLKMHAELSSYETIDISTSERAPRITTTEVDCETVTRDNQTMIIGGLIKRDISKNVTKVPILGDIPILNFFFSYQKEDVDKSELVIFLTPKVVKPGESNLFATTNRYELMDEFTNSQYQK